MTRINPEAEKTSAKPRKAVVVDPRNLKPVLEYIRAYK